MLCRTKLLMADLWQLWSPNKSLALFEDLSPTPCIVRNLSTVVCFDLFDKIQTVSLQCLWYKLGNSFTYVKCRIISFRRSVKLTEWKKEVGRVPLFIHSTLLNNQINYTFTTIFKKISFWIQTFSTISSQLFYILSAVRIFSLLHLIVL